MDPRTATLIVVLVSILVSVPFGFGQSGEPSREIVREVLPALVTVVAVDANEQPLGLGSGFFASRDGVMVTTAHVIEGASRLVVQWQGDTGTAGRILGFDPKYDLVVLETSFGETPAVTLGDSDSIRPGDPLLALGGSSSPESSGRSGALSDVREIQGVGYLQLSVPIGPGDSGGPVLDAEGKVIGVAGVALATGESLNLAVPINLLRQLPEPNMAITDVRYVPPEMRAAPPAERVYATNAIERYRGTELNSIIVSLQNETNDTVGDFQILLVLRNAENEVLNYCLIEDTEVMIPPNLAKQVTLYCPTEGFRTVPVQGFGASSGSVETRGQYEVRILDYQILEEGGTSLNDLLAGR